ncbi:MAG: hypothetical protein ABFR32_01530 [Bacteroidota bacterium]
MKKDNNILNNLKASGLGFKTPNNYFENFESNFITPANTDKNNGFVVPDQYFENVNNEILSKIKSVQIPTQTGFEAPKNYFDDIEINTTNKKPKSKVVNLFSNHYKKFINIAVAASFLLFVGVKYFANKQETISLNDISAIEIENWMDEYSIGFNSYDIAEVYEDIDINNNSIYFEDEISDYLEDKDLEILFLEN